LFCPQAHSGRNRSSSSTITTDSFSDEICGIPVEVEVVATDNFFLYADDTFKDIGSFMSTFTNPVNGKSVVISAAGLVSGPPPIVDEEAGTITFFTTFQGPAREDPDGKRARPSP
jgi:hypothetical protein